MPTDRLIMETTPRKVVSALLLIGWLASLGWLLPTPLTQVEDLRNRMRTELHSELAHSGTTSESTISAAEIDRFVEFNSKSIWFKWVLKLLFLCVGVTGATLMYFGKSHWSVVVLFSSLLLLIAWVVRQSTTDSSFTETYLTYASGVLNSGNWWIILRFYLGAVFFPMLHFSMIVYLLYYKPR